MSKKWSRLILMGVFLPYFGIWGLLAWVILMDDLAFRPAQIILNSLIIFGLTINLIYGWKKGYMRSLWYGKRADEEGSE